MQGGAGGPFGCVIVKEGKIIAEGFNQVTSSNDPTAHAEVVAIREACRVLNHFQLAGCDVYASCEPCPMCLGAIYWARPAHIFFAGTHQEAAAAGFDDTLIYDELKLPLEKRRIPATQILHKESLAIFKAWARQPNKQQY